MPSVGPPEHKRFCVIDEWEKLQSARGKKRDHDYFEKRLANGDILRTKVSRNKKEYGESFWRLILREQLRLDSEEQFWEALETGKPVRRARDVTPPERPTIPVWLVERLIYTVGIPVSEVSQMTQEEAEELWHSYRMSDSSGSAEEV